MEWFDFVRYEFVFWCQTLLLYIYILLCICIYMGEIGLTAGLARQNDSFFGKHKAVNFWESKANGIFWENFARRILGKTFRVSNFGETFHLRFCENLSVSNFLQPF